MTFTKTGGEVFAGYTSGLVARQIIPAEAATWAGEVEQLITAVIGVETFADISTTNIGVLVNYVKTACYSTLGDDGGATYIRMGSAPSPVKPWHVQSLDGAWWMLSCRAPSIEMFGASGASATVDSEAIEAARDFVYATSSATEGPRGTIWCQPGRVFKINKKISFNTPIRVSFPAIFLEQRAGGASPVTFDIGNAVTTAGQNTQYDLYFQTVIASNQNTATPTSIDAAGGTAFRFRNFQFSRFRCDTVRQFSRANYDFDASGAAFGSGNKQHIQQNYFWLGQFAYGGYGVLARSKSALDGAFQANVIEWQDAIANVTHLDIAETSGGDLPADTSVNIWRGSCEKQATHPSGVGISLQGSYNRFELIFCECSIVLQSGAVQNYISALNTPTTGIALFDNSASTTNVIRLGPPQAGQINQTISTPSDNTSVPNNYGVPINVNVLANLTGSAGGATGIQFIVIGPDAVERVVDEYIETASGSPVSKYLTMRGRVPAYWSWKIKKSITGTGTVTYSNASVFSD